MLSLAFELIHGEVMRRFLLEPLAICASWDRSRRERQSTHEQPLIYLFTLYCLMFAHAAAPLTRLLVEGK